MGVIEAGDRFLRNSSGDRRRFDEQQQIRKGEFHFAHWHVGDFLATGLLVDHHDQTLVESGKGKYTVHVDDREEGKRWIEQITAQVNALKFGRGFHIKEAQEEDKYGRKSLLYTHEFKGGITARVQVKLRDDVDTPCAEQITLECTRGQREKRSQQAPLQVVPPQDPKISAFRPRSSDPTPTA